MLYNLATFTKIATAVMAGPKNHFFQDFMGFTCQNLLNLSLKLIVLASNINFVELKHFQETIWPGFMSRDFTKTIFTFCCFPEPASVEKVLGCNFWEFSEFEFSEIAFLFDFFSHCTISTTIIVQISCLK